VQPFNEWLREQRRALDLTQEEAAKESGITRGMWAKLEAGDSLPSSRSIPGIAQALKLEAVEVHNRVFPPPASSVSSDDLDRARKLLERLPVVTRRKAVDALEVLFGAAA